MRKADRSNDQSVKVVANRVSYSLLASLCCLLWGQTAQADRVVLEPDGSALPPQSVKLEFATSPYRQDENQSWIQFTTSEDVEMEIARSEMASDKRASYAFNLQYPILSELGSYPAISLGVRDLFGTGAEDRSLYIAASRSLSLSDHQLRLVREIKLNLGAGTNRIGGLFVGVQARLTAGFSLYAELYRRRPNLGIALPLTHNLQAKVYSLDGTINYGLAFHWSP